MLVAGVLDGQCAREMRQALLAAARACPGGLALDLSGVREGDLQGVAALVAACEAVRAAGHPVGLVAASAQMDGLMVLTGALHLLIDHLDVGPDDSGPPA
ncbi:STAS domain-containing protein [Kitasatospora sp. NPDC057223]|uniref:STAS domain-containing protein n=1 Tax=Kitasatospora sp. NPDC057223 TaxID=3346055 RepID=UPI00363CE4BD